MCVMSRDWDFSTTTTTLSFCCRSPCSATARECMSCSRAGSRACASSDDGPMCVLNPLDSDGVVAKRKRGKIQHGVMQGRQSSVSAEERNSSTLVCAFLCETYSKVEEHIVVVVVVVVAKVTCVRVLCRRTTRSYVRGKSLCKTCRSLAT